MTVCDKGKQVGGQKTDFYRNVTYERALRNLRGETIKTKLSLPWGEMCLRVEIAFFSAN